MSSAQFISNNPPNPFHQEKSKKIYLKTRKTQKSNRKRLNQIIECNPQTLKQSQHLLFEGSIKKYSTSDRTQSDNLRKSSLSKSVQFNIWEKRKELKATIVSDNQLQTINVPSKNSKSQRPQQKHSLRINFIKPHQSHDLELIKIQQSCGHLPSLDKQKGTQIAPRVKKGFISPQKRRSISFSDEVDSTPNQLRHRKNLPSCDFSPMQMDSMRFIKKGKVSGHKIHHLVKQQCMKNHQVIRPQEKETEAKSSHRQAKRIIQKYYSLVKNVDYGRMTNHSGKKVMKNHHLEKLQAKKRNEQNKPSKIEHFHTDTFMKVQAIFANRNKTEADL